MNSRRNDTMLKVKNQMYLAKEEVNAQLACKGIVLTQIQWQKLLMIQKEYCKKWGLIETQPWKVKAIILPFTDSPYMLLDNYFTILKNAIIAYYFVRGKYDWHIDDETIIQCVYDEYLKHFGEQDLNLIASVMKQLNMGLSNE